MLGKSAKKMGYVHPSDIRRMPAEEKKKLRGRAKSVKKRYGIYYEYDGFERKPDGSWDRGWSARYDWYETPEARDQALEHKKKTLEVRLSEYYRNFKPIER